MSEQQNGFVSPLFERALRAAATWHRHDVRKGTDLPYITHPAAVAMILLRAGFRDECLLAAALLHDVVEDTDCTIENLARDFPARVVTYVAHLSEHKVDEGGQPRPWKVRKLEHLDEVAAAPLETRAIVLADKLHNLSSMCYDLERGESLWDRFNAGRDDVLWYNETMIGRAAGSDPSLEPLAAECRRHLEQLKTAA